MKVLIETHGCKLNMADSQVMASQFARAGFDISGPGEVPDVYVLNSCTVTHVADRKARQALYKARRSYPGALIVAAGCYPARAAGEVEQLPGVDVVATNLQKPSLVGLVQEILGELPESAQPTAPAVRTPGLLGRTRASVKIQEGCDQICAYCIVPRVRGRERSVPVDLVVRQVEDSMDAGCVEVVLTGTQLGTYGFDIGAAGLAGLLREVLERTDIPRLRVSSLQPLEITDELLSMWTGAGAARLCPHFHIPLQSGSDRVLRRMRRRYDSRQFLEAVARMRRAAPGCSVTTDIIAGFPGETESDHAETLEVVERARFADCHVFQFSGRPGTTAVHFGDKVDPQVRARRAHELRNAASSHAHEHRKSFIGSTRQVLWEGVQRNNGLTDNYLRVVRQGRGVEPGSDGAIIEKVRLTGLTKHGALIAGPAALPNVL